MGGAIPAVVVAIGAGLGSLGGAAFGASSFGASIASAVMRAASVIGAGICTAAARVAGVWRRFSSRFQKGKCNFDDKRAY